MTSLEQYFSERLLAPVAEREKEATTNKQFHMGTKEYEYVVTVQGHEPTVNNPTNENS